MDLEYLNYLEHLDAYVIWGLFFLTMLTGRLIERKHYRSLEKREAAVNDQALRSERYISMPEHAVRETRLVCGEAVIATEFCRWLMGIFKGFFGGPIRSYETIIDRARREALLRMREAAGDAVEIVNVRLEYAPISYGLGSKSSCVEAIAYGTAVYVREEYVEPETVAPNENVNVTPGSWVADLFKYTGGTLLALVLVFVLAAFAIELSIPHISFETEQKLFGVLGTDSFVEGERMEREERLLQRLVDAFPEEFKPDHPVTVEVIRNPMINAFAFPGGKIVIMSGLLDRMESENEMAFVLGHELGHMANRDHLRGFAQTMVLTGLSKAMEQATGLSLVSDPLGLTYLFFSRKQERTADRHGLEMLQSHYGHIGGAREFFVMLNEEHAEPDWTDYRSTHPDNDKRIRAIRRYSEETGYGERAVRPLFAAPEKQKRTRPQGGHAKRIEN